MEYNLNNPIAERATKTVYRDGDKTIKLFVENYLESNILNEALNQTRVIEATDINIPRLIEVGKINNRWALVFEYIEGIPLNVLMEQNQEKEDEYLNLFVDLQLMIQNHTVPLLNRIKDKFRRKLTATTCIDENTKFDLLQRLEGLEDSTVLCHGDFNPSNVIIKEDGNAYIIDWSHVTRGSGAADAARTFLLFSMEGKTNLANKYIKLFSEKRGIELRRIQKWVPIVAATQMTKEKQEEREFLSKWIDVVEFQ